MHQKHDLRKRWLTSRNPDGSPTWSFASVHDPLTYGQLYIGAEGGGYGALKLKTKQVRAHENPCLLALFGLKKCLCKPL